MAADRGSLYAHDMMQEGPVVGYAEFNHEICPNSFVYVLQQPVRSLQKTNKPSH